MTEFRPELTTKQSKAYWTLLEPEVTELLYGGAKGGGKSIFGCIWMYIECYEFALKYVKHKRKYPIPIAFMGRKQSVDFTNTTLERWKEIIPEEFYELRTQDKEIVIEGRVKIDFGGFDKSEDIKKFNSAAYARIFVDQAEEISQDEAATLRATVDRPVGGFMIPGKILFTANPAQCWLKNEFILSPKSNQRFIQALPTDNPYLDERYIQRLKDSFGHRPELLEAYLYGSWDAVSDACQVLKDKWVQIAKKRQRLNESTAQKVITCDPARFGDDETVIYYLENGCIVDELIYGQKDTMHTANQLSWWMDRKKCKTVAVDVCGVGGGVVDRLQELSTANKKNWDIVAIDSAAKPMDEQYYNRRAEIWDVVAKMFSDGKVILRSDGKEDIQLESQLCVPTYTFRNGKLLIESKEEIKKRLGHSPDRADAYVMGLWTAQTIVPEEDVAVGAESLLEGETKTEYDPLEIWRGRRR